MSGYRASAILSLVILLAAFPPPLSAQEDESPPAEPVTPPEEPADRTPWWGGRLSLYLETSAGMSGSDEINSSIETDAKHSAISRIQLDDSLHGRAVVGWRLPQEKGFFKLSFNGFKEEDGYTFDSRGLRGQVVGSEVDASRLLWWNVSIRDGQLQGLRTPPQWVDALDDANNNGLPDPNEIRYVAPDRSVTANAPDNLLNRFQTYDLAYGREFGGESATRRFTGSWTAGLRHFLYEGNIPAGAWLSVNNSGSFTDGALLNPVTFAQDSSGTGPMGSLEGRMHFLRRRLTAYLQGRAGFMVQSLNSDSGTIYTLARNTTDPVNLYPSEVRLDEDVDKNAWHTGVEVGARFRFLEGFAAYIAYHVDAMQDAVLLPDRINIPVSIAEAPFGSTGIYTTQDLVFDGWLAGASFQF